MTKDIILTISGIHSVDGEADDPIEVMTPGQYFWKNGKHYVLFDEVMEGVEGTIKSTLKFSEQQVELHRKGSASARMVFQKDREHLVIYQTPMGPLSISLYTDDIHMDVGEDEMKMEIRYSLKAENQLISESTMHLSICPKELKQFDH